MKTLGYGLKQGIKNIWQNRLFSLAAVGTMVTCLFLFGIFYMVVSNFQHMVYHAENNVGITVFFEKGIDDSKIEEIGDAIKGYEEVDRIHFTSAKDAWKNFQKEMYSDTEGVEDTFGGENPLKDSASYEVYLKKVASQKKVVKKIQQLEGVRKVNSSGNVARGLSSFNLLIMYVSGTIIVLLLLVSVFLINTAVATGIRVRKDEIAIMQYIGATNGFIKMPFIVEGVLIGIVGAVIPLIVLETIYGKVIDWIVGHFTVISQWLTFVDVKSEFRILIPVCILVGVGVGFLGSSISVRKYLRK